MTDLQSIKKLIVDNFIDNCYFLYLFFIFIYFFDLSFHNIFHNDICEIFSMTDQQKKFFYGNISNLLDH
jgi:hypothetical protein